LSYRRIANHGNQQLKSGLDKSPKRPNNENALECRKENLERTLNRRIRITVRKAFLAFAKQKKPIRKALQVDFEM